MTILRYFQLSYTLSYSAFVLLFSLNSVVCHMIRLSVDYCRQHPQGGDGVLQVLIIVPDKILEDMQLPSTHNLKL